MQTLDIEKDQYLESWETFLDYLVLCEKKYGKFSYLIEMPDEAEEFHIRWGVSGNDECEREWGHRQFDAWGMALIAISKEADVLLGNDKYRHIVGLFVEALIAQRFWETSDCGAWEENHEIRQSSIACAASGLVDIEKHYPELASQINHAVNKSITVIREFGTNETEHRNADLAQLHGVWFGVPRRVMSRTQGNAIIKNIESKLVRENGVIRYENDEYYNINSRVTLYTYRGLFNAQAEGKLNGNEAEWTLGFPTLILAYAACGMQPPKHYLNKMKTIAGSNNGVIPELYYSGTNICNLNKPLGWACNLFKIVLIGELT